MGSPRVDSGTGEVSISGTKSKTVLGVAQQGIVDSVNNVAIGAQQVTNGQTGQGAQNLLVGAVNLQTAGVMSDLGIQQGDAEANRVQSAADAANNADITQQNNQAAADRLSKIQTRLNEEVRLRQQSPGRAQTLLTNNLTPNSMNTKTLLTTAANGR